MYRSRPRPNVVEMSIMPQGSVIQSPRFRGLPPTLPEENQALPILSKTCIPTSASFEARSSKASDDETDSIPHRLPRILKQRPETVPGNILSRRSSSNTMVHFDEQRFVELHKLPSPPYMINQLNRVNLMYVPSFTRAYIGPTASTILSAKPSRHTPSSKSANPQMRKCIIKQPGLTLTTLQCGIGPRFKSEDQKVAWKLSPYQHNSFDMQALRGSSGPYSREFTIHCTAPSNWKRMKWGRHTFQR